MSWFGDGSRGSAIPTPQSLLRSVYVGRLCVAVAIYLAAALKFAVAAPLDLLVTSFVLVATVVVTSASYCLRNVASEAVSGWAGPPPVNGSCCERVALYASKEVRTGPKVPPARRGFPRSKTFPTKTTIVRTSSGRAICWRTASIGTAARASPNGGSTTGSVL